MLVNTHNRNGMEVLDLDFSNLQVVNEQLAREQRTPNWRSVARTISREHREAAYSLGASSAYELSNEQLKAQLSALLCRKIKESFIKFK